MSKLSDAKISFVTHESVSVKDYLFTANVIQPSIEKVNIECRQFKKIGGSTISAEMILAGRGFVWANGHQVSALTERFPDNNCTSFHCRFTSATDNRSSVHGSVVERIGDLKSRIFRLVSRGFEVRDLFFWNLRWFAWMYLIAIIYW